MKKILFILIALLAVTSCGDDNKGGGNINVSYLDGTYQNITGKENYRLVLTLNSAEVTGKSVKVTTSDNNKVATMELINILPNEASSTIKMIKLIGAENGYTFSGEATTTKSKISYSGTIVASYGGVGLLTLDLKSVE